jgi:hypothetical protein
MMHERSYTPPFNLNGYESTITKNLLNLREHTGQEMARNLRERRTKLSKKEAGKRNVDLRFLRKFISVV